MANFSYRFSMYNINGETRSLQTYILNIQKEKNKKHQLFISYYLPAEALNQGDTVDLDALMADLCSIEQELSTISKPNSRGHSKAQQQRGPGGRSASTKHTGTGGGGSSGGSG